MRQPRGRRCPPHAGAADHLEPFGAVDQVGRELRSAADDDGVVVADLVGELAVEVDVHVEALAQERHAGVGDGLSDEDPCSVPSAAVTRDGLCVRLQRSGDRDSAFDVGACLDERELER